MGAGADCTRDSSWTGFASLGPEANFQTSARLGQRRQMGPRVSVFLPKGGGVLIARLPRQRQ